MIISDRVGFHRFSDLSLSTSAIIDSKLSTPLFGFGKMGPISREVKPPRCYRVAALCWFFCKKKQKYRNTENVCNVCCSHSDL